MQTIENGGILRRLRPGWLQTRTQAEDTIWGIETEAGSIEDDIFGNIVLPPDQEEAPVGGKKRVNRPVIGIANTDADNPNVVVSGWQRYDNKGQVVEKYEPFFSKGWDFLPPQETEMGRKVKMYYDPRGQVIRTLNPDGSEQTVIYGKLENVEETRSF